MKALYAISLLDKNGRMVSYNILASSMAMALAGAQQRAGVEADAEPHTQQKLASIDFEV